MMGVMMGLIPPRRQDSYEMNILLGELMGRVEVGVQDINRVTTRCAGIPSDICPICHDDLAGVGNEAPDGLPPCRRTLCGHTFCGPCIERWLSTSKRCPVCMSDVEDMLASRQAV